MAPRRGPAHEGRHGGQAKGLELILRHHQAGCRRIVLLARIARGDDPILHEGPKLGQGVHRGVRTKAFVLGHHHRIAFALRDGNGHHLGVEIAPSPGRSGPGMAIGGVGVRGFASNPALRGDVLRRFDHPRDHPKALHGLGALPPPLQPIVKGHVASPSAPAKRRGVVLNVAHGLHAAGEHAIGGAGLHHHGCGDDGLQAPTTAPIQLNPWHLEG